MLKIWCCLLVLVEDIIAKNTLPSPNIVLIITDDQDLLLNGLKPMVKTVQLLANSGVTFENAYANTPICCPSRSTILTGKYLHNTHVYNNSLSGNCSSLMWQKIHEPFSIASILKKEKGYNNFYAGKYLNQYGNKNAGGTTHVPEGYDWWVGLKGNSVYYNYTLSVNGSATYFEEEYLTDVLKNYATDFLNQKFIQNVPFFMTIATPAPHQPFTPAPRHKNSFPKVKALRTPTFNFSSNDKHWIVQMPPKNLPEDVSELDEFQRKRMQSLLAVDELVKTLIYKLQDFGLLDKTFIIFTSDNGYHLGQFSQPYDKRQPYETDIKIPFLVRGPEIRKKKLIKHPISLVDLAPTILEMAKIEDNYQMDGKSFLKIIKEHGGIPVIDDKIFIEYFGESREGKTNDECTNITDLKVSHCTKDSWCKCGDALNNTYTCVLTFSNTKTFKFCNFKDDQDFAETYDLTVDPYELKNIYPTLNKTTIKYYKNLLKKFVKCKGKSCNF